MSTVATKYVTVTCPSCGGARELTARQARRAGVCKSCRGRGEMPDPTAAHIAWWLENFSDETLADILSLLGRRLVLSSGVARVRRAFVAEGLARPVRVLSSVSERAGDLAA